MEIGNENFKRDRHNRDLLITLVELREDENEDHAEEYLDMVIDFDKERFDQEMDALCTELDGILSQLILRHFSLFVINLLMSYAVTGKSEINSTRMNKSSGCWPRSMRNRNL